MITPNQKFTSVECSTLGTAFRDVLDENGNLFACQLPAEIAETFVENPLMLWNKLHDIAKLRADRIEEMYFNYKKRQKP